MRLRLRRRYVYFQWDVQYNVFVKTDLEMAFLAECGHIVITFYLNGYFQLLQLIN